MAGDEKSIRIIKILKQIAENLTQDEIVTLRTNIKKAIDISKEKTEIRDEAKLKEFLGKYVKMLQFRAGISVNLLKQSIRSLIMISENEPLGNIVYEKFNDYILREHPTLSIGMELDDDLLKAYFKALEAGSEDARHIRLMVVGMYGVGKTTLVNKLLCKPNAEEEPPSTVGIDISVDACEVDENEQWKMTYDYKERESRYKVRLQELFKTNTKQENTVENLHSQQTHQIYTSEPNDVDMETEPKEIVPNTPMETDTEENINKAKIEFANAEQQGSQESKEYFKHVGVAQENSKSDDVAMKPTTVSLWDFAGQSVYYSTHHFFLNPRAIYLLVLDLSKDIHGKVEEGTNRSGFENLYLGNSTTEHFTRLDAFHFWLKSIYIYTQQRKHSHPDDNSEYVYKPTIILVGTHKDVLEKEGKDPTAVAKKYFENALKAFRDSDITSLVHKKKFVVSKLGSRKDFDELKSEIYKVATDQPFWKEKIPGKFIPLEREVEKKKSEREEIMNYDDLEVVSQNSHYPLPKDQINVFLKFQHAFGNLLYYDAANPDMVILKPQWIIDAFKLFVTHTEEKRSKEWKEFKTIAKLTNGLVDECINPEEKWFPFKTKIIKYMEHLDIIAKPVSFVDSDDAAVNPTPISQHTNNGKWTIKLPSGSNQTELNRENFYFMPCMLPTRPSAEKLKTILSRNGISSQVLCVYIKDVFLPPFVFHRIMATCIKKMPILKYGENYVLYNGIGAFNIDPTTVLTMWSWDNMIYFKITSYHSDKENRMKNADLVQVREQFSRLVIDAFKTDGKEYSKEVDICFYVTCPKCPERFPFDQKTDEDGFPLDQKCGLFLLEELQRVEEIICNPNRHHVTQMEGLSRWFGDMQAIETDPRLQKECDDEKFLADLAKEIESSKISVLTRELHLTEKERQRLETDYGSHTLTYIFHILYTMKKRGVILAVLQTATEAAGCTKNTFYELLTGESETVEARVKKVLDSIGDQVLERVAFDDRLCQVVAEYIGEEYWLLGIYLGITVVKLQRFRTRNTSNTDDIIRDFLIHWKNESGGKSNKNCAYELVKAMVRSDGDLTCLSEVFKHEIP